MNELQKLKNVILTMTQSQKETQKQVTLEGVKKESIKCHKHGMSLDAILAPAYKNADFMEVLRLQGIDKDGLKQFVVKCLEEYDMSKDTGNEFSFGTTVSEKWEMTKKGARLASLKTARFVVNKETIWKEFDNFINSLKQETFDHNVVDLIRTLNYGEKSCSEFKTCEEQTENSLKRWPRLKPYHDALYEWIKQARESFNCEV
jgi:hypothetical protein